MPLTRLDTPLAGCRCPACWFALRLAPRQVGVCPRCYALVVCVGPERLQRLVPADMCRLSIVDRNAILARRYELIQAAAAQWRATPRPPGSQPARR